MRLLIGMIFGVLLTVGWAYVSDSTAGANQRPMVNWDVASEKFRALSGSIFGGESRHSY